MSGEINLQGELSITGTLFFVVPTNSTAKVVSMRFNNPAAYTLTLTKFHKSTSTFITVYSLSLSAGDTVTDTFTYTLKAGEYLTATSNIPGTSFILNGMYY